MTDDKKDRLVEKIKKLLALSDRTRNPNEAEAAAAAAKVEELLMQYNLEMADIVIEEEKPKIQAESVIVGEATYSVWKRRLLHAVTKFNFCRSISLTGTPRVEIMGKPHNLEIVKYLYNYLSRVGAVRCDEIYNNDIKGTLNPAEAISWKVGFYNGFVDAIYQRLKEGQKKMETDSSACRALVVQSTAELQKYYEDRHPDAQKIKAKRTGTVDGYLSGQVTGQNVTISPGIGGKRHAGSLPT